jgi:hypothetical protein
MHPVTTVRRCRLHGIPSAMNNGTLADLPPGIDALGLRALEEPGPPTALSALATEVATDRQARGLSRLVIRAMADVARNAGLESLVAPVRPTWKDRYPLIPIDEYATWVRGDGLPFDPWMRVHARWSSPPMAGTSSPAVSRPSKCVTARCGHDASASPT